jgi:hypothetical protein
MHPACIQVSLQLKRLDIDLIERLREHLANFAIALHQFHQ